MNDAVIAVDHNENISIFNKAAEKLFQVNAKDILNKKCDHIFKTFCPLLLTALKNSENDAPQIYNININNQEYIISLSTTIIRNDKGKIDTSFAVIKDITEQKTLEENLKRKDQITAMGHLASGVAHEIRNPLNAISIIAQRFRQEFKPVSEADEYNKLASSMVDQTRRINTIIQQFLKMARPGSLSKSTTNMNNVINQVVTLIKSVAKSKNIKLITNCSELPEISVDSDMIQQALLNIVQNSLDACEQNDTVELNCATVHDNLEIRISDTGHGISKDELHKIFNMYYTTKQEGTGLGLSVVQQIISLHNGTIQVQSEIDKGTVFIIHLPLAE